MSEEEVETSPVQDHPKETYRLITTWNAQITKWGFALLGFLVGLLLYPHLGFLHQKPMESCAPIDRVYTEPDYTQYVKILKDQPLSVWACPNNK